MHKDSCDSCMHISTYSHEIHNGNSFDAPPGHVAEIHSHVYDLIWHFMTLVSAKREDSFIVFARHALSQH